MKYLPSAVAIIVAGWLAYEGVIVWWWFLLIGVLAYPPHSTN